MGKNLFKRLLAFLVMFFGAVTVFSACAKDPYKKMRLSLDKSEVNVTLDDESDNTFSITATVSGVGKKVSKDVRFVIGDNSVVSPVSNDYIKVSGSSTTATFVANQNGGTSYIDVLTLEGGKRARVVVNVEIPVKGMEFAMTELPIERGVKTDITSKFDGVSTQIYDRITYTPSNTTQKDVSLKAYIGGAEASADQILIDGNYITVLEKIESFVLQATNSANSALTAQVQCKVLDTIDLKNIKLVSVAGTEAGAESEDLTITYENGNKVYNVNLANNGTENSRKEISPVLRSDGEFENLYTFNYVKTDKVRPFRVGEGTNSFVVDQGYGHNSDTVLVKVNYKDYEHLFAPKYMTVRVNVSTFPDTIVFTDGAKHIGEVKVYRNYANSVEGATAVLNILYGESVIGGQSVRLSVDANGTEITNGIKLWYYSGGVKHDIDANTLVKHGTKVYISYDYNALGNFVNSNIKLIATSTVNETVGELSLSLVKGIVAPNLANLSNNTLSIENGQAFELGLTESEGTYLVLGDASVALSECTVRLQKGNGDIVSAEYDTDKNVWVIATKGVVGTTKCEITTPNGCKTQFDIVVYEKYTADTLAFRIGNKFYSLADDDENPVPYDLTMPSSSSFAIKIVKLLDGATIDEFGVIDGKYEILQSMPTNLSFSDVKVDGNVVVVDYNDPLIVRSSRNTGVANVDYVLLSKSYDGSAPTKLYINFEITVEARLNDFVVKNDDGQVVRSFSIITRNSLNSHIGHTDLICAKLTAFAYPENIELSYENLEFEVRYQDYMVVLSGVENKDAGSYLYDSQSKDFNGKLSFEITVQIKDNNQIEMLFQSERLDGDNSANITVTLVYKQKFVDLNGDYMTLSNRNTNISGTISNSIKTSAVNFEKDKIDINVNQLNLDGNGKVQDEERAKTSVAFTISASGGRPASAITVKGFYLFYTDNANTEHTLGTAVLDGDGKVVPNNYLICDNSIKVIVDEENNRVNIEILKWTDNLNNVVLYLVPKDLAFDDGNGNLIFTNKNGSHIASDSISGKLSINFCDGTEDNPYIIKDAYDLQFVNNALNSYYKIVNNIILNESGNWTPIGKNSDQPFNGHIITENDQTFVITGLRINKEVEWSDVKASGETKSYTDSNNNTIKSIGYVAYYGLFGYIGETAEISNIRLENVQIDILYNGDKIPGTTNEQKYFDVYLGAFAGLNLGKLTNITVIDDTVRGYDTLKGNVLDTLVQSDENDNKHNSIAYQLTGIVEAQSNHAYIGGVVGVNGGYISDLQVNIALFARDKQEDPTLNGITTTFVGGVAGVNIASNLGCDGSGTIDHADVYSLINATLVDSTYKGMIRNDDSVVGGVVGLNESSAFSENTSSGSGTNTNYYLSKITNITCKTIIIANNYVGGIAGYNYGLIDEIVVNPHIIANDYVGGIAGVSANLSTISATNISGTNTYILNNRLSLNGNGALADTTANSNYSRGTIYHSKVQFVDSLDEISFFNSSIIARNYVGGIAGYVLENNVQNITMSNVSAVSSATLTSTSGEVVVATIGYSSVNSYFVVSSSSIETKRQSVASIDSDEYKYIDQLYMSFDHKNNMGQIDFDKTLVRDNSGVYYGDIILLKPLVVSSTDKNTYVGGIVGLSDGYADTNSNPLTGFGGALLNVYFNATITNTYSEKDGQDLVGTAIIGGVVGKANGLLFVFNANVLGQTKNATKVGGFVGDSSALLDRLNLEGRLPYKKNADGYYVKSDDVNKGYSGVFNINNSYTLLKSDGQYVQNFAYVGEVVEKKTTAGNLGDTGQVSSVKYNVTNSGLGYQNNDNYYYVERKAINVVVNYYDNDTVRTVSSNNPIEKRHILNHLRSEKIVIQARENGSLLYKDSAEAPSYSEDATDRVDAGILKSEGATSYYKKQIAVNGTVSYVLVEANAYSPLYVASADKANMPKYYTAAEVKANGEDVNTTLAGDGVLKYRATEYYRATNVDDENYFTDNTGNTHVTVYTGELLYVEQVPVYSFVEAYVYENGVYNGGNEFYFYNDYIYSSTGKTVSGINSAYETVSGALFDRGESKTKTALAQESTYIDYKVGNDVYDNITISNNKIYLGSDDTTGIDFDDKNMYHNLIKYVVDGTVPQDNTALGEAVVTFKYTRLTASNSYYVGFKTDRYDDAGSMTEIEFAETGVNSSDYYSGNYHYTNINYSDLTFENYGSNDSLAGWYIMYVGQTEKAFEIPEYATKSALIKGEGFVNPRDYIQGYVSAEGDSLLSTYAYKLYEGSGNTGLGSTNPDGEFLYRNDDINHGVPLSFGHFMDYDNNSTLDLIIDLAPETLSASEKENTIYKVDNVVKTGDNIEEDTSTSRPVSLMLDWDGASSNDASNTYTLIGANSIVDVAVLPKFVGNGSLQVRSSDDRIVKVVKQNGEYKLVTLGVGSAIITITSSLNNSLSCDIVVMVKEAVNTLVYNYTTTNGVENIGSNANVLKNNSSIFGLLGKNGEKSVVLQNIWLEYKITDATSTNATSVVIDGKTYSTANAICLEGASHNFKITTDLNVEVRPFYLYSVNYKGTNYLYRKYVDALTGTSAITDNYKKYSVTQTSYAYNIYAPNNISSGIASMSSFEIIVKSNDEILVPVTMDFGYKANGETVNESYKITSTLNAGKYTSKFVKNNQETDSIKVNNLTFVIVETNYNSTRNEHTIKFVAYVDPSDYEYVTSKTTFDITCSIDMTADNVERKDKFSYTILPFQVENVRLSHYTKFFLNDNIGDVDYQQEYKSYKYASTKIVPGYNSLLQADITPSYGKFDYVTAEIEGTPDSVISQVVESQAYQNDISGVSVYYNYPFFETINNASNMIKVVNKYSAYNDINSVDPTTRNPYNENDKNNFVWNGSLLFALSLDSKYSDSSVRVVIKGYAIEDGGDTLQFEQSITLDVVGVPQVAITWDNSASDCYSTTNAEKTEATLNIGGTLPINIIAQNYDKFEEWTVENGLGTVKQTLSGKYEFELDKITAENYKTYINKQISITATVSRVIDGVSYLSSSTIKVQIVDFLVKNLTFVDATSGTNEDMLSIYYNERKDIKISVDALYNESALDELGITGRVEKDIAALGETLTSGHTEKDGTYKAKYLWRNKKHENYLISTGDYSRSGGYIIGGIVDSNENFENFTIKIAGSSVSDKFVTEAMFDYTKSGVQIFDNHNVASMLGVLKTKTLVVNVMQLSADNNPFPIKSINDLKNMVAGESYILLNDLVLSKWTPIPALFKSFDGNGYTITITSFGEVAGLTNIGLFSEIGSDEDLGYYTTVKNLTIDICPVVEDANEDLSIDNTGVLEVSIQNTEGVNAGILAGTNYGIITNVNIINNAMFVRKNREAALKEDSNYSPIVTEDFSRYFTSKVAGKVNINEDNHVDTFSIVIDDTKETLGLRVGGMVGLNSASGYITNSSVERINVKGIDYVAGFVAQNSGYISSSYFKAGSVISNDKQTKANSSTAGFVASHESGKIQFCYVLGDETVDVYDKNNQNNNLTTYIDSKTNMLVINANSPEYNITDKKTGQIKINLSEYAGYQLYKFGHDKELYKKFTSLRALGSAVYTNSYASGFVGINKATVSNCYANILISGTNGAGFAYDNSGSIESSYSMSSIINENTNYYPFVATKTSVDKSFYMYIAASDSVDSIGGVSVKDSFSKATDDVATSLYAGAFSDYNTFTSWGFNSDYAKNINIEDGVWFIPNEKTTTTAGYKDHLKQSTYTENRPELITANMRTISLRYYVSKKNEEGKDIYSYNTVNNWKIEYDIDNQDLVNTSYSVDISTGSINNPLHVATAEDYNIYLGKGSESDKNASVVRMIHDIAFDQIQTANTFSTVFVGNFEGNGLTIDQLRISADDIDNSEKITYLGLFKAIRKVTEKINNVDVTRIGTVRNLNINIEEINGSNINFVGVLAGAIDGGKVYNINISGKDKSIKVEGLNAVGGLAGLIVGEADVVNVTSNISVQANSINKFNTFSSKNPNKANTDFKMFVAPFDDKNKYWDKDESTTGNKAKLVSAIENISYVGGIAGIIDVDVNPTIDTNSGNQSIDFVDRIRQCYVGQSISLSGEVVGGIAGYIGALSNVTNSEFVVGDTTEINALRVGGAIVGHNEGRINRVEVKYQNQSEIDAKFYKSDDVSKNNSDYYNTLDNPSSNDAVYTLQVKNDLFTGNAHYIGGIVGANIGGSIENSYSRVNVINENSAYAGGVIGLNAGGKLDSIYTTGSVYGFFGTGGIIGIEPAIYDNNGKKFEDASSAVGENSTFSYISNSTALIDALLKREGIEYSALKTTYSNIVGANIWRRVDLNPTRSQYYPTQSNSWVGMFVGYMSSTGLITQNTIASRKIYEDTFFKATYKYLQPNVLLDEIGNLNQNETSFGADGSKLNIFVDQEEEHVSMTSGDYSTGDYTYRYSRLRYYGSLRTLNELVGRGYNLADANAVWKRITSEDKNEGTINNNITTRVYYGWDTFNWNGTLLNASGEIINEVQGVRDVFPSIVNNLKPKLVNVYTEDDLKKMGTYLDATFVLQNDINLTSVWMPVGTENKPFTGKLYSAQNQQYSINTLTIDDSNNDYFGFVRVADGAEFRNFNLNSSSIKCNTSEANNAIENNFTKAGAIFIGYAKNCDIHDINLGFTNASSQVYINNTTYVGGAIGLAGNTGDSYVSNKIYSITLEGKSTTFTASMYKDKDNNYEFAFGGIVGKNYAESGKKLNSLEVESLQIKINKNNHQNENVGFTSSSLSIGGVIGWNEAKSKYSIVETITTSDVFIDATTPTITNYSTYVGGAVGYTSNVDYTNVTASGQINVESSNSIDNGTSSNNIGGVFGYVDNSNLKGLNSTQTITYNGNVAKDNVCIGGLVGSIDSVTVEKNCSTTTTTNTSTTTTSTTTTANKITTSTSSIAITTQKNSTLYAGGAIGKAKSSAIKDVEINRYTGSGETLEKLDIIKITDTNGDETHKTTLYAGGLVGYAKDTSVATSNVIGNINHSKDSSTITTTTTTNSDYKSYMGGAIGYACADTSQTVSQVSADVDIIDDRFVGADKTFAYGGLIGFAQNIDINSSYAVGKIYSAQHIMYIDQSKTNLGGLVGVYNHTTKDSQTKDSHSIKNCYSAVEFVLPNSDDEDGEILITLYRYQFFENTQKGGLIGVYNNQSGGDDIITISNALYVKEFVPFSNGYGTAISASGLKTTFDTPTGFEQGVSDFFPRLSTVKEGKSTNISGSGQNPLTTSESLIKSGNTVYLEDDPGLSNSIEIEKRASLVLLGNATSARTTITNKGTIYGGTISGDPTTITSNGSIIGLHTMDAHCKIDSSTNLIITNNNIVLKSTSKGFAYASMFSFDNTNIYLKDMVNCVIVGNSYSNLSDYNKNNLTVLQSTLIYHTTKGNFDLVQASNVDNFDGLSLDINKYWSQITNKNNSALIPSWMYKVHYFDNEYASDYSWIAQGKIVSTQKNLLNEDLTEEEKEIYKQPTLTGTTYTIATPEQLAWVAYQVNEKKNTFKGETIKLEKDIDLSGKLWTPIGTQTSPFKGTFEGNGHTISNMSVVGNQNNGLFGVVEGVNIKNLLISNAQVASGVYANTAILIGSTNGNSTTTVTISKVGIENSHVCGGNTAGFVGNAKSGAKIDISNAYAVMGITAGDMKHYNEADQRRFFFVAKDINASENTINNVYFAEIKYDSASNEYALESSVYIPEKEKPSESYGYSMWGGDPNTSGSNRYIVNDYANMCTNGIRINKKISEMQTQTNALFGTDWGSVWNRIEGKNYSLPRLTFSQKYWIDEGAKASNAVSPKEVDGKIIYTINTPGQLAWVAYQVNEAENSFDFAGKTIVLAKTIDLSGKLWTPIGVRYNNRSFKGSFESAGTDNYINNMICYGAYSTNRSALMSENITADYAKGYDAQYGGLFGLVQDAPTMKVDAIKDYIVDRTINSGAFIAKYIMSSISNNNATISVSNLGSDSSKYIVNGANNAGGIVGTIENNTSRYVEISTKIINANVSATTCAGGVVGNAQKTRIINSSVATGGGDVKINGKNAGGAVGQAENVEINNVIVKNIAVYGTSNAGGIVGHAENNCVIFDSSVSSSTIIGSDTTEGCYAGGIVGHAENSILSALKVDEGTTIGGATTGGIAGYINKSSILQNATIENTEINASYCCGGIVGNVSDSTISEVSFVNESSAVVNSSNIKKWGLVCGTYHNSYFYNFYFRINSGDVDISTYSENNCEKYIFGAELSGNNKYCMINIVYIYKTGSLQSINCKMINELSMSTSSAWEKYSETGTINSLAYQLYYYKLVQNGTSLKSKYRLENANYLLHDKNNASANGVKVIDETNVVITPYALRTFNVDEQEGLKYIADYWTYRHVSREFESINIIKNITLSGKYTPIGNSSFPFEGSIKGQNHSIQFDTLFDIDQICVGLIGYASKLNVENLTIIQKDEKSQGYGFNGKFYVGALVGILKAYEDCKLNNITSYIDVSGTSYVGGLIGWAETVGSAKLTMTNCNVLTYVDKTDGVTISGTEMAYVYGTNYVGGIVGYAKAAMADHIKICGKSDNPFVVQKQISGRAYLGGVVGYGANVEIQYSAIKSLKLGTKWQYLVYARDASMSQGYLGGVIGEGETVTIEYCKLQGVSIGVDSIADQSCIGGVAGKTTANSTISNCNYEQVDGITNTTIMGKKYIGGIVGYAENSDIKECNTLSSTFINAKYINIRLVSSSSNYYLISSNIGGIVGYINAGLVDSCNSKGIIMTGGTNTSIGGIVGHSDGVVTINACEMQASICEQAIFVDKPIKIGGIIGETTNKVTITNCVVGTDDKQTKIYGNEKVGGLIGYGNTVDSTSYDIKNNTIKNIKLTGYLYVGGIMGFASSYERITGYRCKQCSFTTASVSAIYDASMHELNCPYQSLSIVPKGGIMETKENVSACVLDNNTTVKNTTIEFERETADKDTDKGWFKQSMGGANGIGYDNIPSVMPLDLYYVVRGYRRDKDIDSWGSDSNLSELISQYQYEGAGYCRWFNADNVLGNNTWFGPTSGGSEGPTAYEINDYSAYLTTLGTTSGITDYGSSKVLPDLSSNNNIRNFFNSAKGFGDINKTYYVGLLYGCNISNDLPIQATAVDSKITGDLELDSFTHWIYICAKNNEKSGIMVIEWNYSIDASQTIPQYYNFINDTQTSSMNKVQDRINIRYSYVINPNGDVLDLNNNFTNGKFNPENRIKFSKFYDVIRPCRNILDLLNNDKKGSTGNMTGKGLINQFVLAVMKSAFVNSGELNRIFCYNDDGTSNWRMLRGDDDITIKLKDEVFSQLGLLTRIKYSGLYFDQSDTVRREFENSNGDRIFKF